MDCGPLPPVASAIGSADVDVSAAKAGVGAADSGLSRRAASACVILDLGKI